jgi:thiamine biosynthesis lipoprotein
VAQALVDTGELGGYGKPWTVGVQHPREPEAYVDLAKLDGRCMATSGDYATSFSPDRAANHIFDPRTGRSPRHFSSVTVVAPTGMAADALSTAIFVVGLERGLELARASGAEALFVLKDGRAMATRGFPHA